MINLENAFAHTQKIATGHYENFPVGSVLFPKHIRQDIYNLYAFARVGDDIVDSESLQPEEKRAKLSDYRNELVHSDKSNHLIFQALEHTLTTHKIDKQLCLDLLDAFEQDIHVSSYQTTEEIEIYAKRSANPVGRMLLQLFGYHDEALALLSDKICSGLQFINFWQDLSRDKNMKRFYVPQHILVKYQLDIDSFYYSEPTENHERAIRELIDWTETLFIEGKQLIGYLNGRFKLEIRFIWAGGYSILMELKKLNAQLLHTRPVVKKRNVLTSFIKSFTL